MKDAPFDRADAAGEGRAGEAPTDQRAMVDALRDPTRYPFPVTAVTVIETHISFVLLTGTFAYKIKKAVDLGFLDYTRLEQRQFFCHEELRLNRRTAADLYLAVVAIGGSADNPRWLRPGEPGEAIEFAVQMEEFAQADLLDRVLVRGALSPSHIDELAETVAGLHMAAPVAAPEAGYGSPEGIRAIVAASFLQLRSLAGAEDRALIEDLAAWMSAEHDNLCQVFASRKLSGSIRECHGDLHLANVALRHGELRIFDGIEFAPGLRWIDVVSDLAFLVMDLSQHGRADYAWRLLNRWLEITGDYAGLAVLRYYAVHRAVVRALVSRLGAAQHRTSPAEHEASAKAELDYLSHATTLSKTEPGALVVMHGFSGAGKSRLARAISERLGAVRLSSDVERKRLHGMPPLARAPGDALYSAATTLATYRELGRLAGIALRAGYSLVIDATCLAQWQRAQFRDLAQCSAVPFLFLDCQTPPEILRRRVSQRLELGSDASDATLPVLERQFVTAEPLDADEQAAALIVEGGQDVELTLSLIRNRLSGMR